MSFRMNLTLTGETFTDTLKADVGASAFQLDHDWFTRQDLVIRTAAGGGGTLLVEGTDYTLSEESTELSTRVSEAVGAGRNVFHLIAVINVTYQTGNLYFSGKYIADSVAAEDVNAFQALFDAVLPMLRGVVGLTLSNNSGDANNDVDIAAGRALADGATGLTGATDMMTLVAALTKRSDAAWAVGTGNGGMDTGTKPASGTLHVWLIKRPDTGVVDALFSISATSPTMPANYTLKRRIGAVLTSSSNIRPFKQDGDFFRHDSDIADVSTTAHSRTIRPLTVPTGIRVRVQITLSFTCTSSGSAAVYETGSTNCSLNLAVTLNTAYAGSAAELFTDTSGQIDTSATGGTVGFNIYTAGWIDRRGKDEAA